ncbi:MAG: winged helix-turn-helix transcriptional regulator, partial [Raoultibacter sp.]
LAVYVRKTLSLPTTLSLSRVIARNKGAYYKAFSITEDPLNHGEGTFFVLQMMQLIREAQDDIVADLTKKRVVLDEVSERLDAVQKERGLSDQAVEILFQMTQVTLFGMYAEISLQQIASQLNLKPPSTRKYARELEDEGLIRSTSLRPLTFELTKVGKRMFDLDELGV